MKKKFYGFFLVLLLLVVSACSNDEHEPDVDISGSLNNGWEYVYETDNGDVYTISFASKDLMFIKSFNAEGYRTTSLSYIYIHPVLKFCYEEGEETKMYVGEDRITYRKGDKEYVFMGHDDHYPPLYPPTEW